MINFQHLTEIILEASMGQGPKGWSKKSVLADVGLVNRDPRNSWEFNKANMSPEAAESDIEAKKVLSGYYKQLSAIFSIINSKPENKQHAEEIIKDYMIKYNAVQRDRREIMRDVNVKLRADFQKSSAAQNLATNTERNELLIQELEDMEDDVYSEFVNYACELVSPILFQNEVIRVGKENATAEKEDLKEPRPQEYFEQQIRKVFNLWKDRKDRAYQENKTRAITSIRTGGYYGISTAVSSLASWLNNTAARLGDEERRKANNIVNYSSSRDILGMLQHIPEGDKVKRLLDIVDEVAHLFRTASDRSSKFTKADSKSLVDKLKNNEEYNTKHDEAMQIVSDLGAILGSGQFELFKLVQSFFEDEEMSEGKLKNFILNDVVKSFNS